MIWQDLLLIGLLSGLYWTWTLGERYRWAQGSIGALLFLMYPKQILVIAVVALVVYLWRREQL